MSKTSDLRRQATEAVRAKQFQRAVDLYERLCSQDSGNGTPRNELGDVFLKLGDVERAIASFQEAARLYLDFGLVNNAVAVHKKILRHEPNHLHSLWVLGEIRLQQTLEAEAVAAFLDFLGRHPSVHENEREAFVSRGLQLLDMELVKDDPQILSTLDSIFAQWDFGQERARVLVAKARLAHQEGEFDVRDKYVEHARSAFSHLDALPDYVEFKAFVDPVVADDPSSAGDAATDDDGAFVLESSGQGTNFDFEEVEGPVFDAPRSPHFEGGRGASTRVTLDSSDIDLGFDVDVDALPDSGSGPMVTPDDSGAFDPAPEHEIEMSTSAPADELEIVRPFETARSASGGFVPVEDGTASDGDETIVEDITAGTVDLLEQILADGEFDVKASEQSQVDTITQDLQGQIGGDIDAGDHAGQYDLGVVYLDMGLHDQAIAAFDLASRGEDHRLASLEMKGTCQLRQGEPEQALETFQQGLSVPGHPGRSYLGLLYGMGCAHETLGDAEAAREYFERVHAVDATFLDVNTRLDRLRQGTGPLG